MKGWNYPILTKDSKHPGSTLTDNRTVYMTWRSFPQTRLNSEEFSIKPLWKKVYINFLKHQFMDRIKKQKQKPKI